MDESGGNSADEIILNCKVCGESNFNKQEGYFYCLECGTKQEQVRAIEVELKERYDDGTTAVRRVSKKIKKQKSEVAELTSWECYNYILRGMVDDLMALGAKKGIKLTVLQIWAAYLRRLEVAFFNKEEIDMPKLSVLHYPRDARTLYNYQLEVKEKRQRKQASKTETEKTSREFKRSKRKLDESDYSIKPLGLNSEDATSSHNVSGTTRQPMNIQYSTQARKTWNKLMSQEHLNEHTEDAYGTMDCHNMHPKTKSVSFFERATTTLCMKQIYTILAIALNQDREDIQLSDLLRFISEEHLTTRNVVKYLPQNIAVSAKKILKDIKFNFYPEKYNDKQMREHIERFARFIPIKNFKTPDILELLKRYIKELDLPNDFVLPVSRIINLKRPKFQKRFPYQYANFEARIMAYIVYVLKLLFGLDDEMEDSISKSAAILNEKIDAIQQKDTNQSKLFVWSEWLYYVEMRKIIISKYSTSFCSQFKCTQDVNQVLDEMYYKECQQKEQEYNHRVVTTASYTQKQEKVHDIFKKLFLELTGEEQVFDKPLVFPPTLTPAHSYFQRIKLYSSSANAKRKIEIPESLQIDHSARTMLPFYDDRKLVEFFDKYGCKLIVKPLHCRRRGESCGIYSGPKAEATYKYFVANTNITEEEWEKSLKKKPEFDFDAGLVFHKQFGTYTKYYKKKLESEAEKLKLEMANNQCVTIEGKRVATSKRTTRSSQCSAQKKPRLETTEVHFTATQLNRSEAKNKVESLKKDLIAAIYRRSKPYLCDSDIEDEVADDDEENTDDGVEKVTLMRSKFDYWTLVGHFTKLTIEQKQALFMKFPTSFRWLLEICAHTIGAEWPVIYEELLVIETMYNYGLAAEEGINAHLKYTYTHPIKEMNKIINTFREMW